MTQWPLQGEVVFVTGASRGLGREIARRCFGAGAHVMMVARDEASLATACNDLPDPFLPGQHSGCYAADIARPRDAEAALEHCYEKLGHVSVLVNNAAVQGPLGPLESVDWDAWREVFEVDLFAAAYLCRRVIPAMRGAGRGKIINVSGGGATGPRPDVSAYACAKTALVRLTETLAEELKGGGIDVNAVAPGAMNTRMLEETIAAGPQGASREYAAAVERAKAGGTPPEKAAELVAWLASPASDGITGRLISAVWDDWPNLAQHRDELAKTDVYTLRRIVPNDRGLPW